MLDRFGRGQAGMIGHHALDQRALARGQLGQEFLPVLVRLGGGALRFHDQPRARLVRSYTVIPFLFFSPPGGARSASRRQLL